MVAIYVIVIAIASFYLFSGFRAKEMSAMGSSYQNWKRVHNPGMFWFAAFFNLLVLLAGVFLLADELMP
jgi:NADH:ubiquinone oxidoreductase subunit 5 (subunit L)/multisubunit Na+/H+ antiporter MnhA subunit